MSLRNRLLQFGKKPLCNLRRERAFAVCGFCFPLCFRCTGIIVGFVCHFFYDFNLPFFVLLFLLIPMLVDAGLQDLSRYESNNSLRFVTGFLFGFAVGYIGGAI